MTVEELRSLEGKKVIYHSMLGKTTARIFRGVSKAEPSFNTYAFTKEWDNKWQALTNQHRISDLERECWGLELFNKKGNYICCYCPIDEEDLELMEVL